MNEIIEKIASATRVEFQYLMDVMNIAKLQLSMVLFTISFIIMIQKSATTSHLIPLVAYSMCGQTVKRGVATVHARSL